MAGGGSDAGIVDGTVTNAVILSDCTIGFPGFGLLIAKFILFASLVI